MKRLPCLLILSGLISGQSMPAVHAAEALLPIRVILVGDSTMATRSGYGDALCARFKPGTSCVNLARGGRSSGSFRAEGRWDEVQNLLKDSAGYRASVVLVQFGHNDQPGKPGRSTDLVTAFPANMAGYAGEVKQLGGVPVLVTPLTRRSFKGAYLKDDLAPWSGATRKVAQELKVALLDLNSLSADAVQQMGQQEADTLAMAPPPKEPATPSATAAGEPQGAPKSAFDRTHVGPKGAELFSGMVARELVRLVPSISASLN
jgi:lysophospholipase L1-like esterase